MKRAKLRLLSLILALVLALSLTPSALLADSPYYGREMWLKETQLQEGVTYSDNTFWSDTYGSPRHERYFTYTPGTAVRPVVAYGAAVCNQLSTSAAAQDYESRGYRVVGGINGDFFNMGNGCPLGIVVSGGRLLSGPDHTAGVHPDNLPTYYAVGFCEDGSALIGEPQLSIEAVNNTTGDSIRLASINRPQGETFYANLITYDYRTDHTTGPLLKHITALTTIESGEAAIGGALTVRFERMLEPEDMKLPLEENQAVLTMLVDGMANAEAFIRSLTPEDTVTVTFSSPDPQWNEVTEAVGSRDLLVSDGVALSNFPESSTAPRTAVGILANGDVVLYTLDGRQKGVSAGSTLRVLAQRMVEMGCVTAINLDGGGSTTAAAALPGSESARLLNSPSDGSQRKVPNHILLVAPGEHTGVPGAVYVSASAPAALTGQTVTLTKGLVDTNYFPMDGDVQLQASAGTIEGDTLTMPGQGGTVTVTAFSGELSRQVDILALEQPDTVSLLQNGRTVSSLSLGAGETVQLGVSASYRHQALQASAADFTWTADPAVGTIDQNGRFTAAYLSGSGTITVSRGSLSYSIPVTVHSDMPFTDVPGGSYYYAPVTWAVTSGVTTGISKTMFSPTDVCTRGQIVTFLWRAFGQPEPQATETAFTDVSPDAYYYKAVLWAVENGITNGKGDASFAPDIPCTRAEAMTFLYRANGQPAAETAENPFADIPADVYYHDPVLWAVENSITNGRGNASFAPGAPCSRAEIVTFLYRNLA